MLDLDLDSVLLDAREQVERLLEEKRRKWERLNALKRRLIEDNGEIAGLVMFRQMLEKQT